MTRRAIARVAPLVALFGLVTACTGGEGSSTTPTSRADRSQPPASSQAASGQATGTAAGQATSSGAPASPTPSANGPCPYLDTEFVAEANGQRVSKVRISADQPHPACFFYRPDGELQLSVRVYVGDAATAKAVVDEAAPTDTSSPASQPAGWTGGSLGNADGAVYAVAKQGTAVVASTNQQQSVKARRVVETTITNLGL
ncbi:DUF2020 domain-containing protein [Goodfellowiella coeruleoviolacea]|uniref:DUF2020 domain-containing protein n=1 Tax=Goodfellowiella coeruleoviolacea TaxID=334858 RepID=A0AAE3KIY3_9PSEU|nr:DUF2020 domain-containing protein [Goodfellowiella coeruleoviolacea]MCP2168980.1 protein of unknown function (DUF2020) [Goodfellowiella coeruleoviolacea]